MKPIHKLTDRLIKLAEGVSWETFEKVPDGNLYLTDPESRVICEDEDDFYPPRYDYYLRVGIYLNRPMQVIISCHNFIRMRPGDKWDGLPLNQLDPRRPAVSMLYTMPQYSPGTDRIVHGPLIWDPNTATMIRHQAALQAQSLYLAGMQQTYPINIGVQQGSLFPNYSPLYKI